jgi:acetyl-CoA carboxylase biotin carboxyl carrier protein
MAEIRAHITGTLWKLEVQVGQKIASGDTIAILESMKMEMPIEAEEAGTVTEVRMKEGQPVAEGDIICILG